MTQLVKTLVLSVAMIVAGTKMLAQAVTGDWQGTLNANGAGLRLALHITGESGALKATLDSIDQGANGIPVTSIALQGSTLTFTVDAVHGSYTGKLSGDGSNIKGNWTQGQVLPLEFRRATGKSVTGVKPAKASDLDGAWLGMLDAGAMKLRLILHIVNTESGLSATMDSPDQGAKGMPVTTLSRKESAFRFEMKQIGGTFEGTISSDLSSISGTWTQGGASMPLVFKRTKDVSELEQKRPQNPVKPYPYKEEDVAYPNKAAGLTLAATLTIPSGAGPFPSVVLITGSGPQDRDESLMGHKPFLVLADYLTRRGVAVLRADDRGIGKSTGNFAAATTADFATDTEAGITFLKSRPEIAHGRIGLIGHSEGGVIAPMVAARNPDVAFIVMMAGSGVPGDDILISQSLLISEASGMAHDVAEKNAGLERELLTLLKQGEDPEVIKKKVRQEMPGMPEAQLGAQMDQVTSPWFRYFLSYDPAMALRNVKCPVLATQRKLGRDQKSSGGRRQ